MAPASARVRRGVPGASFQNFARRRILGSISDGVARMSEIDAQVSQRRRAERERMVSLAPAARAKGADAIPALSELAVGLALGLMLEGTRMVARDDGADPSPTAYDSLAYRQLQARLGEAVHKLPAREALVVRHHYLNGLSFAQLAELLGVSRGRISQLHQSALERLRKKIGKIG